MVTMTITVSETGEIGVSGPIDDLILSYGVLELARQAIQRRAAEKQAALIRPPTQGDILALRKVQ